MAVDLFPSLPRSWRRRWLLSALTSSGWLAWLATKDAMAARPKPISAASAKAPASWAMWLDHLIPADEITPSATGLHIHTQLWLEVVKDPVYEKLVRFGCQWLDRYHPEGFAGLLEDEREQVAVWMSQAPWESPHRRFFDLVRDHAMTLYYSSPHARRGTLLEFPPQPMGRSIELKQHA